MNKYYHASWDYKNIINTFIPKIPTSALPTEDRIIPRISLCKNITECLTAMAYITNYMYMDSYKELNNQYAPLRIYEFEINESDILSSEEILKYVPDALRTKEIWCIKPIKPIKSYIILPTFFYQEEKYPYDIIEFEYEDEESIIQLGINI